MRRFLLFGLSLATAFGANIFTNPGFEQNVVPGTFSQLATGNTTDLPGWTVTGSCGANCVLVLNDTYTESSNVGTILFQPNSGTQSVDLTGAGNTNSGGVEQTVNLTPNTLYQLTYWIGNQDNRASNYTLDSSVSVFLNNAPLTISTNAANTNNQVNWVQYSISFTPTAAANTIRFQNNTASADNYAGLDDVFLDVDATAVPEPGTFASLGLVLGALGLMFRRRS